MNRHLLVRDGDDDGGGDDEDGGENQCEHQSPHGQLRVEDLDGDDGHDERSDTEDEIPHVRDFSVDGHQTRVDVALLPQAEAELTGDVVTIPKERMNQDGSHGSERKTIRHRKSNGDEHRRVLLVRLDVELAVLDDERRVVFSTGVVERDRRGHGHELGEEDVLVVEDGRDDPEPEHERRERVDLRPPRSDERTVHKRDHAPVECQETHAQTGLVPEKLVDDYVVRRNPAYPVEDTERSENVAREPKPEKASKHGKQEELFTRDMLRLPFAVVAMEGVK